MSFKTLKKKNWITLLEETKDDGSSGYLISYYKGEGKKARKVIGYNKSKAIKYYNEIVKAMPDTKPDKRDDFIKGFSSNYTKWDRPTKGVAKEYKWGDNWIGGHAKKYRSRIMKKDITNTSKTRYLKHVDLLVSVCGNRKNITKAMIDKCYEAMSKKSDHRSPDYFRDFRAVVKQFLRYSKVRNIDELFIDYVIPTKASIKKSGAKYKEKNRQHIEREDVEILIRTLLDCDGDLKTACLFQLWTGARSGEAFDVEVSKSAIKRKLIKTKADKDSWLVFRNSNLFKAYVELSEIDLNYKVSNHKKTKRLAPMFNDVIEKSGLLRKYKTKLDRYCLRHTALTWLMKSPEMSSKDVRDMAGHTTSRMLDDYYTKKPTMDMRSWPEARPLNIQSITNGWHGFLVEILLSIKFPELREGEIPNSIEFENIRSLLKPKTKIKQLVL